MSSLPNASPLRAPRHASSSDEELLARTADGDREAFGVLVERHRDPVHRWVCTLTSDESLVDDVLQETFIAAFRHAHTFQRRSSVRTWLFTIARNQVFGGARKQREHPHEDTASLEHLGRAAGWGNVADPEEVLTAVERKTQLRAALGQLEPRDREVIVARDLSGLTGPETAELLGVSLAAMKARLHRARLRLVAELRTGRTADGT